MIGDVLDDVLIDVSEFGLLDLLDEVDESSLAQALHRISTSSEEGVGQHGFSSRI